MWFSESESRVEDLAIYTEVAKLVQELDIMPIGHWFAMTQRSVRFFMTHAERMAAKEGGRWKTLHETYVSLQVAARLGV